MTEKDHRNFTLCEAAEFARSVLANLPPAELSERMAIEALDAALTRDSAQRLRPKDLNLEKGVHDREAELIGEALALSGGSPTRAARLLGVPHQGLLYILNTRHKDLPRTPIKHRNKAVIKKQVRLSRRQGIGKR